MGRYTVTSNPPTVPNFVIITDLCTHRGSFYETQLKHALKIINWKSIKLVVISKIFFWHYFVESFRKHFLSKVVSTL